MTRPLPTPPAPQPACALRARQPASLARQDWEVYRNKAPIAVKLVVVTIKDEPYFLELGEGDYVNVLEWQPKGKRWSCEQQ